MSVGPPPTGAPSMTAVTAEIIISTAAAIPAKPDRDERPDAA